MSRKQRKYFGRRARTRTSPRRSFFARRSRNKSGAGKIEMIQFDSMAYGALRGYASGLLAPIASKIPLGGISDEVLLGGVNYLLAKNTGGFIKKIAMKGLVIENARLGEALIGGGLGMIAGTGQTATIERGYNYG